MVLSNQRCAICGNTENNRTHIAREMMLGLRDKHEYLECGHCGCVHIVEIPSNIQDYYPSDNYYSYDAIRPATGIKGHLIRQRDRYAATGKGLLGSLMQRIQPHDKLPALQHAQVNLQSKILDVGCGAGHLLHAMQEAGFTQLLGIDPFNTEDIAYPNGLIIAKQSIHEMPNQAEWDVIMFNHSYEHVADQVEVLEKTWQLLKPNGVCMLRIPTVSSWAWQHYHLDWVQLDAPRHFFLHSIKSVELLAEKTGFMVDDVQYDSFAFQYWGSEQYKQDIALHDENSYAINPKKAPFSEADMRAFAAQSKQLNKTKQGDQAAFYLKKVA